MKVKHHAMLTALVVLAIALLSGSAAAYDMADYFPLNQGDAWIYVDTNPHNGILPLKSVINGNESINEVETTKFVGGIEDGNCYAMDSEGLKLYKWYLPPGYLVFDLPKIIFPAQFDVGETYQGTFSASVYSTDDDSLKYVITGNNTITLDLVEDVTVGAGTFEDCLKISTSQTFQTLDDSNQPHQFNEMESTAWYARNIGLVKSIDHMFGVETVLISANVDGIQYGYDCPVAAALGADSGDLTNLRIFRDEVLSETPIGRTLIKLYYDWSPSIVVAMEKNEILKKQVRKIIEGVLPLIKQLSPAI